MKAVDQYQERGDSICHDDDGCPTEGAVLKREWRAMRDTLARIKARCCGEASPNWENTPATGVSRGWIADECDIALGQTPNMELRGATDEPK